ncbi:glycine betaine ABC transporter substrate-binding protein [Paracoccus sp. APAP_BH8]|uniref:glycine betaine ABC transporter substrate-binding protein n=1 Tax=Paracoccus TaxID=265 RepID=UPI0008EF8917|nr:glycine betaine ABC transporter substrate-binding protein [Paracoccus pantotrophus]MDF3855008.1 glycine betaine ABC transporter substrate-binding protein [Paracoccus pantotrophus]RNI18249.1 ABC transporter substrate-binding protein [Paracoccus pantotrophus]SFO57696.1 glycine betaine/proline transport system substrate-binding protein [Paracoccus pantotrophus]
MKKLIPALLLGTVAFAPPSFAQDDCGDITIGALNWQSAEVLAYVHAFILEHGFGCSVSVIAGDTVPTITSMVERGQPDVAPEANLSLLPAVAERGLQEGRIVALGKPITEGTLEGWYVPKFIVDENPEIKTIEDALARPELFPAPEDPSRGGILVGPEGWGGTVVTNQLFKAFGAEQKGFTLVNAGSAAGLDGAISRAYERKEGYITYYWSPTSLLAQYPMVRLEGGVERDDEEWQRCTTVGSCPDPKPNYWVASPVSNLVTQQLLERPGMEPVKTYFEDQTWSTDVVSELILWMQQNQATGENGARRFLENSPEVWREWVPEDVAEKVQSAL